LKQPIIITTCELEANWRTSTHPAPARTVPLRQKEDTMNSALQLIFVLALLSQFYFTHACQDGECRQLLFPSSLQKTGKRLIGHNITIKQVGDIDECEWRCYQQPCCVSINFRTTANTQKLHRCELNNATYKQYAGNLAENNGFIYRGAEVSGKAINI